LFTAIATAFLFIGYIHKGFAAYSKLMRHFAAVVFTCVLWSSGTSYPWPLSIPLGAAAKAGAAKVLATPEAATPVAIKAPVAGSIKGTGRAGQALQRDQVDGAAEFVAKPAEPPRTGKAEPVNSQLNDGTSRTDAKKFADEEKMLGVKRGQDGRFLIGSNPSPDAARLTHLRAQGAVRKSKVEFFERTEDGRFNHIESGSDNPHVYDGTAELTDTVATALFKAKLSPAAWESLEVRLKEQLRSFEVAHELTDAKQLSIAKKARIQGASIETVDHIRSTCNPVKRY
jgi:hypothetical protein